jgi:V/A-type H+/Na+-transporting ATPase subunit I
VIVPMKRIVVVVVRGEMDQALRKLRGLGVVHIKPVQEPDSAELAALAEQAARLEKALILLGPAAGIRPFEFPAPETTAEDGYKAVEAILLLDAHRGDVRSRLEDAEARRAWFRTWGDFSRASVDRLAQAGLTIRLYAADKPALKELPAGGTFVVVGRDKGRIRLAWLTQGQESGLDLKEETIPDIEVADLEAEIASLQATWSDSEVKWSALAAQRNVLRAYEKRLRRSTEFARVRAGLGREEAVSYLEGFCPAEAAGEVKALAEAQSWGYLAADPDDPAEVPTLIRNPGWVRAIQPLFKFMGTLPGYAETDVSLWFLGFLSLFFALLIGDAGYGLIFLGATLGARRRAKSGSAPEIFRLMILFSLATIVWGILSGVYFGFPAIARLPILRSLVVPRLDGFVEANASFMMFFCFIIGLAHLSLAHLINVIRLWPSPRLLGQVGWISIVWAVFFLVGNLVSGRPLPGMVGPLLGGGILLALVFSNFQKRVFKGILTTLLGLPLSVIGTFSDLMSYLRLFAVGFASLTVAASFNAMAVGSGVRSLGQGVLAAVVLLFGHSLNIVLGGMSVLVHGVRLNMLEFSNHLGQQWTGLSYEPFRDGTSVGRGRNPLRKENP